MYSAFLNSDDLLAIEIYGSHRDVLRSSLRYSTTARWRLRTWEMAGFPTRNGCFQQVEKGYIQIMRFFLCLFRLGIVNPKPWSYWGTPWFRKAPKIYMILPAKTWSHVAKMDMHTNYIGIIVIIVEVVWGFLDMFRKKMGSNLQRSGISSRNGGYCSWYGHWFTIQLEYYQSMKGQSHSQPVRKTRRDTKELANKYTRQTEEQMNKE